MPVYITEYDINVADDTQQKNIMQDQITMFWNDANVKGITLWGYIVGLTWETNTGLQQQSGNYAPRDDLVYELPRALDGDYAM